MNIKIIVIQSISNTCGNGNSTNKRLYFVEVDCISIAFLHYCEVVVFVQRTIEVATKDLGLGLGLGFRVRARVNKQTNNSLACRRS